MEGRRLLLVDAAATVSSACAVDQAHEIATVTGGARMLKRARDGRDPARGPGTPAITASAAVAAAVGAARQTLPAA